MPKQTIQLAALDIAAHTNTAGMIRPEDRDPDALLAFLAALGVKAVRHPDRDAIEVEGTRLEADRIRFSLVCLLASRSYANEAAWWIGVALGTVAPDEYREVMAREPGAVSVYARRGRMPDADAQGVPSAVGAPAAMRYPSCA